MYRAYAADPRMRINLGIRRRLAPLLDNDRAPDRADERAAVLAARHAGHLLRRRDRHGRQHLPRRPQRRAHADAVEPATATPASRAPTRSASIAPLIIGPGLRLRGGQRRGAAAQPVLAALHWMRRTDRAAQALQGVRPRHDRVPAGRRTARCSPTCAQHEEDVLLCVANLSRFAQPVELDLSRVRGVGPGRDARPHRVPAHRDAAVLPHARAVRLLLVRAEEARVTVRRTGEPPGSASA